MLNKILLNKSILIAFLFVIAEQVFSGISNYSLVKLTGEAASLDFTLLSCSVLVLSYIGCELLSLIPSNKARMLVENATFDAIKNYVKDFKKAHENMPILNADAAFREGQKVWLSSRAPRTLEQTTGILYNGITFGLRAISSVAVASDLRLIFGFTVSGLMTYIINKFFKKDFELSIRVAGERRGVLDGTLQSGLENILLGNRYNHQLWNNRFNEDLSNARNSSLNAYQKQFILELLTRTLISLPVLLNALWLMSGNFDNKVALASLFASVAIQVRALPELGALASYAMLWNKTKTELQLLENSLLRPREILDFLDVTQRIQWNKINIKAGNIRLNIRKVEDLLNFIHEVPGGERITLIADNGAGKSTLLLLLKKALGNDATYFKPGSELIFKDFSAGSDGEKTIRNLRDLFSYHNDKKHIYLLDEWDRALDETARIKMNNELHNVSWKNIVIEITHRKVDSEFTKISSPTLNQSIANIPKTTSKNSIPGLNYQPVPGDGHCLFTAVAIYVGQDQQFLRNIVAAHIEHNMEQYRDIIQALNPGRTPEEYLRDLRQGIEWADNLEIAVLMRILDRPIVVVESGGRIRNLLELTGGGDHIFVQYNGHNHYDALVLTGERNHREIFEALTQLTENSQQILQNYQNSDRAEDVGNNAGHIQFLNQYHLSKSDTIRKRVKHQRSFSAGSGK